MPVPNGFTLVSQVPEDFEVIRKPLSPNLPEGFTLTNPAEGGFFAKASEAMSRGRGHALANVAIYTSIYGDGDLLGALNLRRKLIQKEVVEPIESNWLSDIIYTNARTVGQMWETTKKSGKGAIIGATAGGVIGVGAGMLLGGPTGEEAPLGVVGAKVGAAIGGGTAAASFSFREGFGAMYADMIDQGVPAETAKQFANYGAIPYALIEVLQLKTAAPALKEGIQAIINKTQQKVLKKAIKTYGKRLSAEVIQEMGQEVVQIAAVDVAKHLSGQGIDINADYIKSKALRLYEVGKESAKAFALIPAPGVAIDMALQSAANTAAIEHQTALAESEGVEVDTYSGPIPDPGQVVYETEGGKVIFEGEIPEVKIDGAKIKPTTITEEQLVIDSVSGAADTADTEANLPPVTKGNIRLYRGQDTVPREDAGAFFTPFLQYAENYAKDQARHTGTKAEIVYIDIPKKIANKYNFTKINEEDLGLKNIAREYNFPQLETSKVTLNPEYTRGENETEDGWSQRVMGQVKQKETRTGLQPTDVDLPIGQFQIAIDNALAESIKRQDLQEEIRKTERSRRFGEMESIAGRTTGADWRKAAKGALSGAYTALGISPLQEVIPIESFQELDQELRVTNKIKRIEALKLGDAMQALFKEGKILRPHEIGYARKIWGSRFADSLQDLSDAAAGKSININDYIGLPRSFMTSMDVSRTLRQNILLIGGTFARPKLLKGFVKGVGRPTLWAKALGNDLELFVKDKKYARTIENMALRENAELVHKSGIRVNKWGPTATARTGSERFPSKIARQVPFIARSERAYTVGGNLLRMSYLNEIGRQRAGIVTTDKQWKDIGHVINILTGEGDARRLLGLAPILNAVFFAPRLLEARVRAFTDLFNPNLSWASRKILAQHVASFVGFNITLLASMAMVPGVNVEDDWRSTDYGKIKIGNTRIDFWGGYLPLARLFMRLASGEVKAQSGRIVPVTAKDTITSFLQSKLGPMPAYALDLLKGKNFVGEPTNLEADNMVKAFYEKLSPLFMQDLIDATRFSGPGMGAAGGALAFFGASVTSYPKSKSTEVQHNKNMLAQQVLGVKWDALSDIVQDLLRDQYPEIEYMEREAKFDRSGFGFLTKMAEQRDKSVKKMYKAMPGDVQEEFDSLNLKLGGVSSKIGTDWFLNEERRKQYEKTVTALYRTVLPKLIRSPKWDSVPPIFKLQILTKVMNELKEKVRQDILASARIEDIQRIKRIR